MKGINSEQLYGASLPFDCVSNEDITGEGKYDVEIPCRETIKNFSVL